MAFLFVRTGVLRPDKLGEGVHAVVEGNKRFKEWSGAEKTGVYHQIGAEAGRISSLIVFDDVMAAQKAMSEYYSDPENRKISGAILENFIPQTARELLLIRH